MSGLELLPLGVGDAFTAIHFTYCLALRAEGTWLVVDCPHPFRRLLRDGSRAAGVELDSPDVSGVVLTHLHADHASGLEDYAYYSLIAMERRARLFAHPDVAEHLWERKLRASMESLSVPEIGFVNPPATLETFFELETFTEDAPLEFGPFRVECRKTLHTIPTTALRIHAGGRCLGLSSDTAFSRPLVDWLGEADMFLHEVGPGIHSHYEDLLALPEALRAKIRLIHYADDFDLAACELPYVEQGKLYSI